MSWINRLVGSLRKRPLENDLDDELQFHIEMRVQEFIVFGRDPNVIGKVFRVEGLPFTVIGVTPREFSGTEVDYPRDITLPVDAVKCIWPRDRLLEQAYNFWLRVMVRPKPGSTMKSARPVLRDLWPAQPAIG